MPSHITSIKACLNCGGQTLTYDVNRDTVSCLLCRHVWQPDGTVIRQGALQAAAIPKCPNCNHAGSGITVNFQSDDTGCNQCGHVWNRKTNLVLTQGTLQVGGPGRTSATMCVNCGGTNIAHSALSSSLTCCDCSHCWDANTGRVFQQGITQNPVVTDVCPKCFAYNTGRKGKVHICSCGNNFILGASQTPPSTGSTATGLKCVNCGGTNLTYDPGSTTCADCHHIWDATTGRVIRTGHSQGAPVVKQPAEVCPSCGDANVDEVGAGAPSGMMECHTCGCMYDATCTSCGSEQTVQDPNSVLTFTCTDCGMVFDVIVAPGVSNIASFKPITGRIPVKARPVSGAEQAEHDLALLRMKYPSAILQNGQVRILNPRERTAWFQEEAGKGF